MRSALASLGALLMVACSAPVARGAPPDLRPIFFMFSTSRFADTGERGAVAASLRKYVTSRDYLSAAVAREFPDLGQRVGRGHRYVLPTSLSGVERESAKGCGPDTAGLVIYDGEHWAETPADEQAQMSTSIARGRVIVGATSCHDYGIAPDGQFIGISPSNCSYDLSAAIHQQLDWSGIALFNIQAQILLSDRCGPGVDDYVAFVAAVTAAVRTASHPPAIAAQLSFRYTPPERMIAAITRLRDIVNGFYIAYPSYVGQTCTYCSAGNLEQVLGAIRSR
jgi:hypothetical protein